MPVTPGPAPDPLLTPVSPGLVQAGAGPRRQFLVRLPGWDDVLHLRPTALLSAVERRARAMQAKEALARSPTPAVVSNLARIAQEIDAVQDAMVVLSVGGRVAVKVAGRAIPGVGVVSTAADLLNLVNVFYPPTLARAALGATGAAGARLSGRSRYVLSREAKRQLGGLSALQSGTYRQRLAETVKTGKVGFGWGEALQVLQTSDELYGIGVSLGPIFGAMQDTFFGLLRGAEFDFRGPALAVTDVVSEAQRALLGPFARFAPDLIAPVRSVVKSGVRVEWPGFVPVTESLLGLAPGAIDRAVAPLVAPIEAPVARAAERLNALTSVAKQVTVRAAARVWTASSWLVGLRGDLSWADHVELAVAQFLALDELAPYLEQTDWGIPASVVARQRARPEMLPAEERRDPPALGALTAMLRDGPARRPLDWLAEAPSAEAAQFAAALVSTFAERFLIVVEAPGAVVRVESSPLFRALRLWHEADALPPYARTDVEVLAYLDSTLRLLRDWPASSPPLAGVRLLWSASFPGAVLD